MGRSFSQAEEVRRVAALVKASSDSEAAELLGIGVATFSAWRRRRGYPVPSKVLEEPAPGEPGVDSRFDVYRDSGCDQDAADALGISRAAFRAWRLRQGLPSKQPPGRPAVLSASEVKTRMEAYHGFPSDNAAAKALGISQASMWAWRKKQGLPAKQTKL